MVVSQQTKSRLRHRIPKGQINLPWQCLQNLVHLQTKSRLRAKCPRGKPTSLDSVCKFWSVRKYSAKYTSPGASSCDIKVVFVMCENPQQRWSPGEYSSVNPTGSRYNYFSYTCAIHLSGPDISPCARSVYFVAKHAWCISCKVNKQVFFETIYIISVVTYRHMR